MGISCTGNFCSERTSLIKRGNFSRGNFSAQFVWVCGCRWTPRSLFCPDVVGEGTRNSYWYEKFPLTSQSSSGIFPLPWEFLVPDDPNQVVQLQEIPTKRISHLLSLALTQGKQRKNRTKFSTTSLLPKIFICCTTTRGTYAPKY